MNKTIKDLLAKIEKIENGPENRNPAGSFYIFKALAGALLMQIGSAEHPGRGHLDRIDMGQDIAV